MKGALAQPGLVWSWSINHHTALCVCARARVCVSPFRHHSPLDCEFHSVVLLSLHEAASRSHSTFRFLSSGKNTISSLYSGADVTESSRTVFLPPFASVGKKCTKVRVDVSLIIWK